MREHLRAMEAAHPDAAGGDAAGAGAKKSNHAWAKKFGPLAPLLIFLAKFKGLFFLLLKFKFLFSFLSFIWLYVLIYGWWYGLGFAASIFIHEMGHFVEIKRRGYPAEMPVFLPGLGAYVRWQAMGVTVGQAARVSLAGPLAGWLAAVVCLLMYLHTHNPVWAALARTGAVLNLMNLIPVWVLDGSKALDALGTQERLWLLVVCGAVGWIFSQWFFALVAAGIAWRIFTAMRAKRKNNPAQMDWGAWAYYAGLLIALGALMHVTPVMQGISRR
jgi:Zn-dependent protease